MLRAAVAALLFLLLLFAQSLGSRLAEVGQL
jgi:hypothetical protein